MLAPGARRFVIGRIIARSASTKPARSPSSNPKSPFTKSIFAICSSLFSSSVSLNPLRDSLIFVTAFEYFASSRSLTIFSGEQIELIRPPRVSLAIPRSVLSLEREA